MSAHGQRRRRLVVVSPTFFPEPLGTPLYTADTVEWFAEAGWDVRVVTAQPFYPQFERYEGYDRRRRRDSVHGVPVYRLPTIVPRRGAAVWRAVTDGNFFAQGVARAVAGVLPRSAAVLSVSPGSPVAPMVGAALRQRGGVHVCLVHDIQSGLASGLDMVREGPVLRAMQAVERAALMRADRLLTLSAEMRTTVLGLGVRRPVDVLPLWATIQAPASPPAVLTDVQFSGNIGRKQGLEQLVPVLQRIRDLRPSTTFTIRGAGPLEQQFQAQLDAAGLGIRLEPPVDTADLPGALASSRVHIVPQLAATATHVVPSKIVNALAVGAAIVAFCAEDSPVARMAERCAAIRTVPPDAVDDGARAVVALLDGGSHDGLRTEAIEYVRAHHDRDALLQRLAGMLQGDPDAAGASSGSETTT